MSDRDRKSGGGGSGLLGQALGQAKELAKKALLRLTGWTIESPQRGPARELMAADSKTGTESGAQAGAPAKKDAAITTATTVAATTTATAATGATTAATATAATANDPAAGTHGPVIERMAHEPAVPVESAATAALEEPEPATPPPAAPHAQGEPLGMLDLEEPPETYGIDEIVAVPKDPHAIFVAWEATPGGWDRARGELGGDGHLVVRLWLDGGACIDHPTGWDHGRRYVPAPSGAHVTAALGLIAADGRFATIATAPRVRVPFAEPGPEAYVEWMEVTPSQSRGASLEAPIVRRRGPAREIPGAPGFGGGRSAGLPGWYSREDEGGGGGGGAGGAGGARVHGGASELASAGARAAAR